MTNSLLASIQSPEDVRKLDKSDIPRLAREIRKTIIDVVGTNGGHLSSNLGVVELTIALHRVFFEPAGCFYMGCWTSVLYPQAPYRAVRSFFNHTET